LVVGAALEVAYRDCRTATRHQREARQPIGSGSSASERAKIITAMKSPLMKLAGISLKCMWCLIQKFLKELAEEPGKQNNLAKQLETSALEGAS
jgi:hypothetical protein